MCTGKAGKLGSSNTLWPPVAPFARRAHLFGASRLAQDGPNRQDEVSSSGGGGSFGLALDLYAERIKGEGDGEPERRTPAT